MARHLSAAAACAARASRPAAIGAFVGSLYLPWAFRWALGPIADTISSDRFGRRLTWIVGAQILMAGTLLAALPIDFSTRLQLFTRRSRDSEWPHRSSRGSLFQ